MSTPEGPPARGDDPQAGNDPAAGTGRAAGNDPPAGTGPATGDDPAAGKDPAAGAGTARRTVPAAPAPSLLERASRAAFWNAVLLPVLSLANLAFAIVIRRRFGLFSGVYDIVLGLQASLLLYSSLGIPTSLTKFLPEIEASDGGRAVQRFLGRAVLVRLVLLAAALVPINLFAEPLSRYLDLGASGPLYLGLLTALVAGRALVELCIKSLSAYLAQLRANLLQLVQALVDIGLVAVALLIGLQMGGVLGALAVSSLAVSVLGAVWTRTVLADAEAAREEGPETQGPAAAADPGAPGTGRERGPAHPGRRAETRRFLGFAAFTYVFELGVYFSSAGFTSPALAVVAGREEVALFATAFKLSFMTVGLVVAGFRGLYRPVFTRLRARRDPGQMQRAFSAVTKAQLVLLVPAGIGLWLMTPDYLPLMFGREFVPATPVARVLVALMFAETAFNLGIIVLSIDERYRAVLWTQSLLMAGAPLFVVAAATLDLVWAAAVFGGVRLLAAVIGYGLCHRLYGFRFPWAFAARVLGVGAVMGVVVAAARAVWPTSLAEALVVTALGALVFVVGMRVGRILGPEEVELLERARFPGRSLLMRVVAPRRPGAGGSTGAGEADQPATGRSTVTGETSRPAADEPRSHDPPGPRS